MVRRVAALVSFLAVVFLFAARAAAGVEVTEASVLPGWCAGMVPGEEGPVDVGEVRAECAHLERQFPGLEARVFVLARWVEAQAKRDLPGGDSWPPGRLLAGAASPDVPEACVFSTEGYDAFVVAHELGHLVWFRLLSPERRAEYVSLRGLRGKPEWYVWECFAEDFRLAFGSRRARCLGHSPLACGLPAEFVDLFTGVRQPAAKLRWSASEGRVDVYVEERRMAFPDVQPWVDPEGRAWAPLRPVVEALGRIVGYDSWTERAFVGDLEFDLRAGLGPGGVPVVPRGDRACCPLEGLDRLFGGG